MFLELSAPSPHERQQAGVQVRARVERAVGAARQRRQSPRCGGEGEEERSRLLRVH